MSESADNSKTEETAGEAKLANAGLRSEPIATKPAAPDMVETALSEAIQKAAAAGAFDVLPKLVAELEARRKARQAPEIVDLEAEREKRKR